jgi:trigger factor
MSFEVESRSDTQAKVRLRLPREAVDEAVAHELGHLQEKARIPGFRPGKVPRGLLQKRLGESLLKDVRRKLVVDAFQEGIAEEHLHPVDLPALTDEQLTPNADGALEVALDLEVIPHVDPTGYEKIAVTPPPIEIKEEDVERELEGLRRQAAQVTEVADGETAPGDVVVADLTLQFLDGSSLPVLENRLVDTGAGVVDGVPCEDAKTKFARCRRGEVVKVSMKLPEQFPVEEHRGKTAMTDCAVKDLRRVTLPELNAPELPARFGAKDLVELRLRVRERMGQIARAEQDRAMEAACVDALVERNPFPLPAPWLQRSVDAERDRIRRELASRETPPEQVEQHMLEIEGRLRADVERRLRETFLLDRLAEKLETNVAPQELEQQFALMAHAWQMDAQTLFDQFHEQGLVPRVVEDVRRAKVRRRLREMAATSENDEKKAAAKTASEKAK